jgi:hypothetical protein
MPSPTGWLTNWVQLTNTSTSGGAWLNPYVAKLHPSCLLSGAPSNFRVPVNVNTRDAGGNVNLTLSAATFAYGTLGDQGTLERGGTYVVPRELGVAIAGLGAGTLS